MEGRKKFGVLALTILMIIFQSFTVYAEDSVTIKSVAVNSVNFEYKIPSYVTNFKKYVEIPVKYKGNAIGRYFTQYFKKEVTMNGYYLAEGNATFRAHAYACNNGDTSTKLGVYLQYLDTKGVWQNFVYYEGVDVVNEESINDIWTNSGKYYIDITELKLHPGDEQNRNIDVEVCVKDSLGASFQDRHANIELATILEIQSEAQINLQTAYRPYGVANPSSTLSSVSTVKLDQTNQTVTTNIDKIKVARGAAVAIDLKGTNLTKGTYIVAKTGTPPTLPYETDKEWNDLKAFNVEKLEWQKLYPDMDIDKQGYIAVKHYVLDAKTNVGKDMITNHEIDALCVPINETPVYQVAGMDSSKAYYTEADKSAFFQHEANEANEDKSEAQGDAAKFSGYIVPDKTGDYNLALRLYGDAYGYVTVNGKDVVFVNETNNASNKKEVSTVVNTAVHLEADTPYPIYIEWYDGNNGNKQTMIPCYKLTSESDYKDIPSNWFYPEANNSAVEKGSMTSVSASDKIQLPAAAGEYYVILKIEGQDGKDYETSYGPVEVNVDEVSALAEEDKNKIVPASISNIYWETTYGEPAKKLVYTLDVSQLIDATCDGKNPMATYDLGKAVASIEDETGRIASSNYKITHNKKTIRITFNEEYAVAAGKTHKISIFIPTQMGQQVRYDKYLKDICKTTEQVSVQLQAQEIYYNQDIVDGVLIETEAYISVNHDPENINVVYGEIPRIS